MTLISFYIIRHGYRSDWDTNGTELKSPTGLHHDPRLSAFGEVQAREVANYFKSLPEDQRPTAIFSSPSYRCLQTSKPVAIALGVPIYVEHGISEWYPPVKPRTKLHPLQLSAPALKAYFPEIDDSWSSVLHPSRRGEDSAALYRRIAGFLTVFVPEVQQRFSAVHKRVLLVSHAATVIALARELVGDRGLRFRARCCSLTVLDRKATPVGNSASAGPTAIVGDWTARLLGDDTHLKDGKQRPWGVPDVKTADGEAQEQGPVSRRKTRRMSL